MRVEALKGRVGYWLRELKPDCSENSLAEVITSGLLGGGIDSARAGVV
jgi:hypothetical protein